MDTNLKYKPLSVEQLIISIDRLTRFKYTKDKYLRVFRNIITSNLITPKLSEKTLDKTDLKTIVHLAEEIINFSLKPCSGKNEINKKLKKIENSYFILDEETQILLNNSINYKSFIKMLEGQKNLPINLKRLCNFEEYPPIKKLVIAEGITEEILLPKFAEIYRKDFIKNGIYMISAGGKNQVVKLFYDLADKVKLPIFILLDNDAKKNSAELLPKLRNSDKIYVIKHGEFEDILPISLIKRTLNRHYKDFFKFSTADFNNKQSMVKNLEELFKKRGEFKKSEFAKLIFQNINGIKDLSKEIKEILDSILLL